ncbi:MAG: choice-of-anchor J domain-containing protein [Paludibacteraceae bacterium]
MGYKKTSILSVTFIFLISVFSVAAGQNNLPQANFTIPGEGDMVYWQENFDNGATGWVIQSTNTSSDYNWKRMTALTGTKSFTTVDPADKGSMFIMGLGAPRYGAQNEWLISPEITAIPANATLKFYGGYSLAWFSSGMNVELKITTDNGTNWTKVWDAKTQSTGDNPTKFRLVSINLESYVGKSIKLAWVYTATSYGGDFVLDGIRLLTPADRDNISIMTGDSVKFFNTSTGDPQRYLWTFEGGVPATSTETNPVVRYYKSGIYSVSLTAINSEGSHKTTKSNMVSVDDRSPVAHIGAPSMFKTYGGYRAYFVPCKENISFYDLSENYPSTWNWSFGGGEIKSSTNIEKPVIYYPTPDIYTASLTAGNTKGQSSDMIVLQTGYKSFVSNLNAGEVNTSFKMDENQFFPGNNSKIEAYAEFFEKPAIPVLLDSVQIYFVGHSIDAQDILTRIKTFRVRIYKAENMQPVGKEIAWGIQDNLQVEYDNGNPTGIYFGSDLPLVIDFPFFVVVEEIPYSTEYPLNFTMGMAPWRNYGNTAYLRKKGEDKFISAGSYFGKDKQTSYAITPRITYLVLQAEKDTVKFDYPQSNKTIEVKSTYSWTSEVEDGKTWCRIASKNSQQIDGSLTIACDKNDTQQEREAIITLYNGYRSKQVKVIQAGIVTGVSNATESLLLSVYTNADGTLTIHHGEGINTLEVYSIDGKKMMEQHISDKAQTSTINVSGLQKGIYVLRAQGKNTKGSIKILR